jgi:hypothetical protein
MKIRPVGGGSTCSVWTDGRSDMKKLTVAFRDITKAPKRNNEKN